MPTPINKIQIKIKGKNDVLFDNKINSLEIYKSQNKIPVANITVSCEKTFDDLIKDYLKETMEIHYNLNEFDNQEKQQENNEESDIIFTGICAEIKDHITGDKDKKEGSKRLITLVLVSSIIELDLNNTPESFVSLDTEDNKVQKLPNIISSIFNKINKNLLFSKEFDPQNLENSRLGFKIGLEIKDENESYLEYLIRLGNKYGFTLNVDSNDNIFIQGLYLGEDIDKNRYLNIDEKNDWDTIYSSNAFPYTSFTVQQQKMFDTEENELDTYTLNFKDHENLDQKSFVDEKMTHDYNIINGFNSIQEAKSLTTGLYYENIKNVFVLIAKTKNVNFNPRDYLKTGNLVLYTDINENSRQLFIESSKFEFSANATGGDFNLTVKCCSIPIEMIDENSIKSQESKKSENEESEEEEIKT